MTIHGWKVLASYSRGSALWSHFECPWGHQERWRQFDAHQQTGHTPDTEPQSLDYHLPLNAIPYCILKPDLIQQRQTIDWLAHLPFKGVNSSKYYTSTEFLPHSKHMSSPLQRQTGNNRSRSPVYLTCDATGCYTDVSGRYIGHILRFNRSSRTAWPLKSGMVGCPETSVFKYQLTPRKIVKGGPVFLDCLTVTASERFSRNVDDQPPTYAV